MFVQSLVHPFAVLMCRCLLQSCELRVGTAGSVRRLGGGARRADSARGAGPLAPAAVPRGRARVGTGESERWLSVEGSVATDAYATDVCAAVFARLVSVPLMVHVNDC